MCWHEQLPKLRLFLYWSPNKLGWSRFIGEQGKTSNNETGELTGGHGGRHKRAMILYTQPACCFGQQQAHSQHMEVIDFLEAAAPINLLGVSVKVNGYVSTCM